MSLQSCCCLTLVSHKLRWFIWQECQQVWKLKSTGFFSPSGRPWSNVIIRLDHETLVCAVCLSLFLLHAQWLFQFSYCLKKSWNKHFAAHIMFVLKIAPLLYIGCQAIIIVTTWIPTAPGLYLFMIIFICLLWENMKNTLLSKKYNNSSG